jgi:5-methyltetrahydrofolate--homocysteine methyltransferase
MLYKPDWEQARQRFEAWWEGEIIDRAAIQVIARRDGAEPVSDDYDAWWPPQRFLNDPEYVVDTFEAYCRQTYFGGEAFLNLWINLGPGIMAAYLGAVPQFRDGTTWFETPKEWDEIETIVFDPGDEWWGKTCKLTSVSVERGRGKFLTGLTDIGGNLDIAASLRGSQRLCMDLFDFPDRVKEFGHRINEMWFKYYSGLYSIISEGMAGTSAWMGIWSPKRWYPLQCDLSAMISPKMFEEFVLPRLQKQCRWLDHAINHLDGPGQIPHLDMLLDIEELDGVQ